MQTVLDRVRHHPTPIPAPRGVYKKDIKASDFSNPYLLDALKIGEWTARSINMAVGGGCRAAEAVSRAHMQS